MFVANYALEKEKEKSSCLLYLHLKNKWKFGETL